MRKCRIVLFLFLCCLWVANPKTVEAKKVKIKKITIQKKKDVKTTIGVGKSRMLRVKVSPSKAKKKIKFTTSNKSVLQVNSKGKITGKKQGSAYITVKAKDGSKKSDRIRIYVGKRISGISITNKEALSPLVVDDTVKIDTELKPEKSTLAYKKLAYKSSNKNVATVSKKGVIKGKGNGTTKITVFAQDGSGKKATARIKVVTLVKSVKVIHPDNKLYMAVGGTVTLEKEISPSDASNKVVEWTTSNAGVATVSDRGVVKAVGAGTVRIYATATDGTEKTDSYTLQVFSLTKDNSKMVAHRGLSYQAPENSMTAIKKAINRGFYAVEVDLWRTIDGVFVLNHEDSMLEMYNVDRKISESTYAEVSGYYMVSGNRVDEYSTEEIVRLEALMDLIAKHDIHVNLEIKWNASEEELYELMDIVSSYNIPDRVNFITFESEVLTKMKEIFQGDLYEPCALTYLCNDPTLTVGENIDVITWCIENKFHMIFNYNVLTEGYVNRLHAADLEVGVYTVNNIFTAFTYLRAVGVDTLTTDRNLYTD